MMKGKSLKISDYLSSLEKKNPVGDISAGNETIRSFFFGKCIDWSNKEPNENTK